jgi:hypothetical protein
MCPQITPDFTEVMESIPAGVYKANIVEANLKTSQAGNTYVKWQFRIFDATDSRCNGKSVWTNTMLSGPGAFRLQQLVKAALGETPAGALDTDLLMGKSVQLTLVDGVDKNTGEKNEYAEVKAVRALT